MFSAATNLAFDTRNLPNGFQRPPLCLTKSSILLILEARIVGSNVHLVQQGEVPAVVVRVDRDADGVLEVTVEKRPESKPVKIQVN
jgi:hypothetical protein